MLNRLCIHSRQENTLKLLNNHPRVCCNGIVFCLVAEEVEVLTEAESNNQNAATTVDSGHGPTSMYLLLRLTLLQNVAQFDNYGREGQHLTNPYNRLTMQITSIIRIFEPSNTTKSKLLIGFEIESKL